MTLSLLPTPIHPLTLAPTLAPLLPMRLQPTGGFAPLTPRYGVATKPTALLPIVHRVHRKKRIACARSSLPGLMQAHSRRPPNRHSPVSHLDRRRLRPKPEAEPRNAQLSHVPGILPEGRCPRQHHPVAQCHRRPPLIILSPMPTPIATLTLTLTLTLALYIILIT